MKPITESAAKRRAMALGGKLELPTGKVFNAARSAGTTAPKPVEKKPDAESPAKAIQPAAPDLSSAAVEKLAAAAFTSIVYSGTGSGKYGPFIPLAAGDAGIRSVQQFNLSASYVSGVLNLVLCKPLLTLPITTLGVTAERDLVNQFASMPKIYDGACLAWLMLAGAATPVASPLSGHLEFGWTT